MVRESSCIRAMLVSKLKLHFFVLLPFFYSVHIDYEAFGIAQVSTIFRLPVLNIDIVVVNSVVRHSIDGISIPRNPTVSTYRSATSICSITRKVILILTNSPRCVIVLMSLKLKKFNSILSSYSNLL